MDATTDRLAKLHRMLERQPTDPFLLYGVAMEHKKAGDIAAGIEYLDRTIAADPNYCYAYYQKGQMQQAGNDPAAARASYRAGIDAANRTNDAHAKAELEAALEEC